MHLRVFYVIAESQMAAPLREAVARLNADPSLPVRFELDGCIAGDGQSGTDVDWSERLSSCDILIASMLNTDRDVRSLEPALQAHRPPVTVVFASQPELMAHTRIGPLDGRRLFQDRDYQRRLVEGLRRHQIPLPLLPHVLLAAVPRLEPRLGREGLGDLWAYARAALYWMQGSVDNLTGLLLHLASQHPACDRETGTVLGPLPAPRIYPEVALWHPDAPGLFTDLPSYLAWYEPYWASRYHPPASPSPAGPPRVGVVLFRQYITAGSEAHYRAAIRALEAEGLQVIPGFGGLDNRRLLQEFMAPAGIDLLLNLTGFNLVGSMGNPQPGEAVRLLQALDVPYLVSVPLLFQTPEGWQGDPLGLPPIQTALQVVLPELEGGIEPRVFAGQDGEGRFQPIHAHVQRLARRVHRWIRLRRLPPHRRRVALVVFSFPPDKGSIGSAAYLDVFESLYNLMQAMAREGYRVEVPADAEALREALLGGGGPGEAFVADGLDGRAYRQIVPYATRLARQWGPPPGDVDTYRGRLLIKGRAFGHVFVGIQPSFGYEGDPMRLLLSPEASPSHSFAGFYAWLADTWGADAVVHVGTHGALEFMPGKQVGLTPHCYPDLLIGDLPHLYLYAVNNPAEATIAKRRGYAVCASYLTPPLGNAGLYRDLAELQAALRTYRQGDSEVRRRAAAAVIRELIHRAGLQDDLAARGLAGDEPFAGLDDYLQELQTEQIPLGLHVAGRPLTPEAQRQFLAAALAHPRPEQGLMALDELVAAAVAERAVEGGVGGTPALSTPPGKPVAAFSALGEELLDYLLEAWERGSPAPPPPPALAHLPQGQWDRLVAFSRDFLDRLNEGGEIQALLRGLAGRYIAPSPGGEPGRHPDVLPTGRNIHALDPYRIPSPVARRAGKELAEALLNRFRRDHGRYPETVALVLWGTDNIKSEGEGVAQALHLMGVEVAEDSRGRATRLRLIPLEELGRPRIDVVMTVSGIFRDIFPSAMELLDEAARLAASAEEPPEHNYVRRHALAFQDRLGVPWDEAASRVFSNRPGQYGTGVNAAVESSQWDDSAQLGHLFIERKGFAFGVGRRGEDGRALFHACLATAEVTFQNIDSSEISLADVDHYFEYLGGVTAAVQAASNASSPGPVYVADRVRGPGRVRSLREALQVEARTRLLNPAWYEKMLEHGYQGVHEVATRLDNTLGWSATAQAVGEWVYSQAADTFLLDEDMRRRLASLNPQATYRMAGRLLEAAERGYWTPDARQEQGLRRAFLELENQVELSSTV